MRRFAAILILLAPLLAVAATASAGTGASPPHAPAYSLLALGDTGKRRAFGWTSIGQTAVAQSMAWLHERQPVDGLVLLGDNFYPKGLEAEEQRARIAANLVRPYCPFLALDGACSPLVADACDRPASSSTAVPLLAVLGNHDHGSAESPALQRDSVPCFVPGWDVPRASVARRRLAPGIDLIRYDSSELARSGDYAALRAVLAASPGPWRILAAHHPLAGDRHAAAVAGAVAAAGVAVQLHLAGHDHNLQLATGPAPFAAQIVSGAGSEARAPRYGVTGVRFLAVVRGFVRLDWVRSEGSDAADAPDALEIGFYEASPWPIERASEPTELARFAVSRNGDITTLRGADASGYSDPTPIGEDPSEEPRDAQ